MAHADSVSTKTLLRATTTVAATAVCIPLSNAVSWSGDGEALAAASVAVRSLPSVDQPTRQDRRHNCDEPRYPDQTNITGPRIEAEGQQLPNVHLRADPCTERPEALQIGDQERPRYQDRLPADPLVLT